MNEEIKWHINYESIFVNNHLHLDQYIFKHLFISTDDLKPWPKFTQLPQLCKIYELFENFLLTDKNWVSNACNHTEIQAIQYQLNILVATMQCEKQYGRLFWKNNKRMVQASIIHFYIFFTRFISVMLIPGSCENIIQVNNQDKLITKIIKLQQLVNNIIIFIKPLYQFMLSESFIQEQKLTQQFLQQFNYLFANLPIISKKDLNKIPKLMEYVVVCTSIDEEISQIFQQSNNKKMLKSKEKNKEKNRNNSFIKDKNKFEAPFSDEGYKFIVFGERIKRNSFLTKKKKFTVTTKYNESNQKSQDKSLSFQRSRSISPSHDHRSLTIYQNKDKKELKIIKREYSPEDISDDSFLGGRSRNMTNMTSITNESTRKRQVSQLRQLYQEQQVPQMERGQKKKKEKKSKDIEIKYGRPTNQMNIQSGKCRGWGILRQYLQKKIAQRKMKKLLQF